MGRISARTWPWQLLNHEHPLVHRRRRYPWYASYRWLSFLACYCSWFAEDYQGSGSHTLLRKLDCQVSVPFRWLSILGRASEWGLGSTVEWVDRLATVKDQWRLGMVHQESADYRHLHTQDLGRWTQAAHHHWLHEASVLSHARVALDEGGLGEP